MDKFVVGTRPVKLSQSSSPLLMTGANMKSVEIKVQYRRKFGDKMIWDRQY